jgi:Arc/MetJ family transcription regulator
MGVKKTSLLLDEELVETAKDLTGVRSTKGLVDLALRRLVRNERRRRILRLAGKGPVGRGSRSAGHAGSSFLTRSRASPALALARSKAS